MIFHDRSTNITKAHRHKANVCFTVSTFWYFNYNQSKCGKNVISFSKRRRLSNDSLIICNCMLFMQIELNFFGKLLCVVFFSYKVIGSMDVLLILDGFELVWKMRWFNKSECQSECDQEWSDTKLALSIGLIDFDIENRLIDFMNSPNIWFLSFFLLFRFTIWRPSICVNLNSITIYPDLLNARFVSVNAIMLSFHVNK